MDQTPQVASNGSGNEKLCEISQIKKNLIPRTRNDSYSDETVREKMKKYWQVYEPTLESMMLSMDARHLSENEQNEVLSYLPNYRGLKVLELGAGIGRFTKLLAESCEHVTAVDFMESYTEENRRVNSHFDNVKFICADVTQLDFPTDTFDLVYSNWLLMYLNDLEVEFLMSKVLRWIRPGGHFFFRESCYHQSGNLKRFENPTEYRTPLQYIEMLQRATQEDSRYDLVSVKNILTYVMYHSNPNQLAMLARKIHNLPSAAAADNGDICRNGDDSEEGQEYSAHLQELVKTIIDDLQVVKGQRILHLNCNQAEVTFDLVSQSGSFVHGVDSNPVNIHKAIKKQGTQKKDISNKVQLEFCHLEEANLNENSYHSVIYVDSIESLMNQEYFKTVTSLAQRTLRVEGKLFLACYISKNSTDILGVTAPTVDFVNRTMEHYDFTLLNGRQNNVMALSLCRSQAEQLKAAPQNEKTVKRLEHLNQILTCLKDGTFSWMTFVGVKTPQS